MVTDVASQLWKVNLPSNILLLFVAVWQMAEEGQSDKTVPAVEVHMKQRCAMQKRMALISWSHVVNFFFSKKCRRYSPQPVKWCALSFGVGKGWSFWISCNLKKYEHWLLHHSADKAEGSNFHSSTFLLHHDNTRSYTILKTVEHVANLGWNFLPHPLYSLDLMPFDFHLFRLMEDRLCGYFPSYNAIIVALKLGHLHWCPVHSVQSCSLLAKMHS